MNRQRTLSRLLALFLLVFLLALTNQRREPPAADEVSAPEQETPAHEATGGETTLPGTLIIDRELSLELLYDDIWDFADAPLPGYSIAELQSLTVLSNRVEGGQNTGLPDGNVLERLPSSESLVAATGVGTAELLLVPTGQTGIARAILAGRYDGNETVHGISCTVTVKPAVLTMLYLAGQSNMAGTGDDASGHHPEDSIMNRFGTVYSTYITAHSGGALQVTGLADYRGGAESICSHIAGALNSLSATAVDGKPLVYPLYALTEQGQGKTGPDSALAYEWNRLQGDKVWVINCAQGYTTTDDWQPGAGTFELASSVFALATKTAEAEIQAGHFTPGNRLLFWLQGEYENDLSAADYTTRVTVTFDRLRQQLSLDAIGMLSVRPYRDYNSVATDVTMTGPRISQYAMGASEAYPDVFLISNVNERWTSNTGVWGYFSAAYPDGQLSYPLRSSSTLIRVPDTVQEVHSSVHYTQVGYNENGIDAARNMVALLKGGPYGSLSVCWLDSTGVPCTEMTAEVDGRTVPELTLQVSPGEDIRLYAVAEPIYLAKSLVTDYDPERLVYDPVSDILRCTDPNGATLLLRDREGTLLSILRLETAAPESSGD